MDILLKYFPDLTKEQEKQFAQLEPLYREWNEKINVISRKDIDALYEKHVLHSLVLTKIHPFRNDTKVLDIGTGGGFPGIPLAIYYPNVHFHLVDSVGKKMTVVNEVVQALGLKNVTAEQQRAENIKQRYHYILTRAVARVDKLLPWVRGKFVPEAIENYNYGLFCYKGGDLEEELKDIPQEYQVHNIKNFLKEDFFEAKKIVHIEGFK